MSQLVSARSLSGLQLDQAELVPLLVTKLQPILKWQGLLCMLRQLQHLRVYVRWCAAPTERCDEAQSLAGRQEACSQRSSYQVMIRPSLRPGGTESAADRAAAKL